MKNFLTNVNAAFDTAATNEKRDSGEIVSLVLTIAGFAVIAILAVNWLGTAVLNKAADAATCIESSSTYKSKTSEGGKGCDAKSGELKSFKTDKGYLGRKG